MKVGDTIFTRKEGQSCSYKVLKQLGEGGQGSVWKVEKVNAKSSEDKYFALKLIHSSSQSRDKIVNIERLVNEKADEKFARDGAQSFFDHYGINHVLPLELYTGKSGSERGYIMELVKAKTLDELILDGTIVSLSLSDKLNLLRKIARSIVKIHDLGYCYTDISFGNFMWDKGKDILYVIDCDNISGITDVESGKVSSLMGTGFFMAPEVAFRKKRASINADKYAFATLAFRIIMNNYIISAYHGKAMYDARPLCSSMDDVYDREDEGGIDKAWRYFIFDPAHSENSIKDVFRNNHNPGAIDLRNKFDKVTEIWNGLPQQLKELFKDAFMDPFDDNGKRPDLSKWITTIDKILNIETIPKKTIIIRPIPIPIPGPYPSEVKYYSPFIPTSVKKSEQNDYTTFVPKKPNIPPQNSKGRNAGKGDTK